MGEAQVADKLAQSEATNRSRAAKAIVALIAIGVFVIAIQSKHWLGELKWYTDVLRRLSEGARLAEQPLRWLMLCTFGLFVTHRTRPWRAFSELGMTKPIHIGVGFGFVATLPMLAVALIFCKIRSDLNAVDLIGGAVTYVFAEELLFRGYLFRQLYRGAGWNIWVAAISVGVLFGALHLANRVVQDMPIAGQFGTVAIISVGGVLFAWVYAMWDDNLWIPFSLHGLMNLWFALFAIGDNPLGGWLLNSSRVLTGVLAVFITLYVTRDRGLGQRIFSRRQSAGLDTQ